VTRRQWLTVPDELVEHADLVADYHESLGYSVGIEARETGFPGTPTFVAKRGRTRVTVIVEVRATLDVQLLQEWVRFAKACPSETRVVVCLPEEASRPASVEQGLREAGVGILLSSSGTVMELVPSRDLTINVSLPEIRTMPPKLRRRLGPVYEKFQRGEWQDGFGDACQVLEAEAVRYLKDGIRRGRLTFRTQPAKKAPAGASPPAGKVVTYTDRQIDRMPIGALADAFAQIETQNYADAAILRTLRHVNRDRIGKTHYTNDAAVVRRLRANVGKHMWVVVEGLKAAMGIPL
jgi:hypothetical protein